LHEIGFFTGTAPPLRQPEGAPVLRGASFMIDSELLAYLLAAAVKFSGLPAIPVADLPPIQVAPAQVISSKVCPDEKNGCTNLVAAFETDDYVILVRDTLNLETSLDNSFLLHELVHVLQYKARGADIFKDCPTSMRTETEAYKAQNAYLKKEGQFARFGEVLSFTTCAGEQNTFFTREIMVEPNLMK
jgi:hypothetical protein